MSPTAGHVGTVNLRALLASPLGFAVGLSLGALGGGGSIIAVPALVYGAGLDARQATSTSLVLVGVASIVGLQGHMYHRRVRARIGASFAAAGIPGSVAGTAVNHRLDPDLLLVGFAGLVFVAAWRMVYACPTCTNVGEQRALRDGATGARTGGSTHVAIVAGAGVAVGFVTGLFGVGGGFVIVPALTLLLGMDMPTAIGTSLLVIAINSSTAFAMRLPGGTIDWPVTMLFTATAVVGVRAGAALASRLDPRRSLRAFAGLLVVIGAYTALDGFTG